MLSVRTGSFTVHEEPVTVKMSEECYKVTNGENGIKEKTLLEDEFSLYPRRNTFSQLVKLTKKAIIYKKTGNNGEPKQVHLELWDVAGVTCGRPKGRIGFKPETNTILSNTKPWSDIAAYICLYAYPYTRPARDGGIRVRKEIIFKYSKEATYEQNLDVVQKWRLAVQLLLRTVDVTSATDIHLSRLPAPRRLLLFVNPASGRGKGKQVFARLVAPLLEEAGIIYTCITTEKRNHAREIVRTLDMSDYEGVVIVSGDGLVYEVLNGLMDRHDRKTALQIPIGVIPAGSGNAMSSAVLGRLGENYKKNAILHSTFILTKPGSHPLDLVRLQHSVSPDSVSFLSVAWGIIADIDIESERYRFLGAARFTMGAFVRIVNLRHYSGRLSFLSMDAPYKTRKHVVNNAIKDRLIHNDDNLQREHMPRHHSTYEMKDDDATTNGIISCSIPRHSSMAQDLTTQSDLHFDDTFVRVDMETNPTNSTEEGDDSGLQLSLPNGDSHELSLSNRNSSSHLTDSGSSDGIETTLLLPLSEPVPSNWTIIEGEWVGIVITYMSHLSQDVISCPGREFDEGSIAIQYLKYPTPRKGLIDLQDAFQDGSQFEKELIELAYCRAFRIEPDSESGIMTVDGERIEYSPIQGELLPNIKGKILTPSRR